MIDDQKRKDMMKRMFPLNPANAMLSPGFQPVWQDQQPMPVGNDPSTDQIQPSYDQPMNPALSQAAASDDKDVASEMQAKSGNAFPLPPITEPGIKPQAMQISGMPEPNSPMQPMADANVIDSPSDQPAMPSGWVGFQQNPNKSRRENIRDEIDDRQHRTFGEKRGWLNTLKGAGIGFLKAYQQSDPRLKFADRLLQAVGGGGAGLAQGTIDPNTAAKWGNQQHLQDLYGQYGQQSQMDEAEQKIAKAGAETQGAMYDNINKRSKDYLSTALADNKIDDKEASTLRTLTGLPYAAADWRKVIRFDDQGVPFIAREGEEAARPDASRPINPAAVPKERTIPGQGTFQVSDDKAFPVAGQMAVGNANREQSASQYAQTQAATEQNREFTDKVAYQKELESHNQRVLKAKAELGNAQKRSAALGAQLEAAKAQRAQLAQANHNTDETDKQISALVAQKAAADGDVESANVLMTEPAPTLVTRPTNPKTSKGGKNNNIGTQDDYRKAWQKFKR